MRRAGLAAVFGVLVVLLGGCTWTHHMPEDTAAVRAGVENWRTDTYGTRTAEY